MHPPSRGRIRDAPADAPAILAGLVLIGFGILEALFSFGSAAMVVRGIVVLASERRLWRGAIAQSGLGLAVAIATLV